jgi:hypothetical protein
VEKDSDGSRGTDSRRGIKGGCHGKAVRHVVSEISQQVEIGAQFDTLLLLDFLLDLLDYLLVAGALMHRFLLLFLDGSGCGSGLDMFGVFVAMAVAAASVEHAHHLVHEEEEEEAHKDAQTDKDVLLIVDNDDSILLGVLAQERVRKQMEKDVAEKTACNTYQQSIHSHTQTSATYQQQS